MTGRSGASGIEAGRINGRQRSREGEDVAAASCERMDLEMSPSESKMMGRGGPVGRSGRSVDMPGSQLYCGVAIEIARQEKAAE